MANSQDHNSNIVGPWATIKLDALERYLNAYLRILSKQNFDLTYIDAFAGSPEVQVRKSNKVKPIGNSFLDEEFIIDEGTASDQIQFISGSPIRALNANADGFKFDRYYFFDLDETRYESLKELEKRYGEQRVWVLHGDANAHVKKAMASHFGTAYKNRRGVAFLDPYGPHLNWDTIEAIANTKQFDIIINFPLEMAINRQILTNNDYSKYPQWKSNLNRCFGDDSWEKSVYEEAQPNLFGQPEYLVKKRDAQAILLDLYLSNLRKLFQFVSNPRAVRNTKGNVIYHLIWASNNERGLAAANHILNMEDLGIEPRLL